MNILTGYLPSTSGEVKIDGLDILDDPTECEKRIGFLPEQPPLYTEMTVGGVPNFVYELKSCGLDRRAHLDEVMAGHAGKDVRDRVIANLPRDTARGSAA